MFEIFDYFRFLLFFLSFFAAALQILYADALNAGNLHIPDTTPRVAVWFSDTKWKHKFLHGLEVCLPSPFNNNLVYILLKLYAFYRPTYMGEKSNSNS
jgi:hypothetical protein